MNQLISYDNIVPPDLCRFFFFSTRLLLSIHVDALTVQICLLQHNPTVIGFHQGVLGPNSPVGCGPKDFVQMLV